MLFPLEMVSGIRERDVIHTVRVSPIDAQDGLSKKALKQKVTGANLGHFAAFFKRSWRSNDILWGRLDGACELVDTLVDATRLNELRGSGGWNAPSEAELADYLPQLSADKRRAFAAALGGMTSDAATVAALPLVKDLLIEAAQGEILVEGLPQVIEDAAEEQMLWNEYNRRTIEGPGRGARKTTFVAGAEVLDPAVIAQASAEIAKGAMAALVNEKPATTLVARFREKYDVGSETLDDIPRVVLLDVFARALLVVRNSLLQAAGEKADRLTGSLLYKAFLDWPLEILASLAGGLRRSPSGRRGVIVGTLLYVALSAIVVFKTRLDFGALGSLGPALFIGLPALMLGATSFLVSVRSDDSIRGHARASALGLRQARLRGGRGRRPGRALAHPGRRSVQAGAGGGGRRPGDLRGAAPSPDQGGTGPGDGRRVSDAAGAARNLGQTQASLGLMHKPAWWIPGAHLQTIWARLARSRRLIRLEREVLTTPDDDDLILDHTDGAAGTPRVLLLHGLEGSAHSLHTQGLALLIAAAGWRATVLNFRSCARDPPRSGAGCGTGARASITRARPAISISWCGRWRRASRASRSGRSGSRWGGTCC